MDKLDALYEVMGEESVVKLSECEKKSLQVGFFKGFSYGINASGGCDGCVHEPEKKGGDPYPDVCGNCSRFYSDMHSKYFMEN
jgi:hypothetical protein